MPYIDTHAHLYLPEFDADRGEVLARARATGVAAIYLPNIDRASLPALQALVAEAPGFCFPMLGLHPCSVGADYATVLDEMERQLDAGGYVGIGETGLDLHWDTRSLPLQQAALTRQAHWARSTGLPLILHSRAANAETLALLQPLQDGRLHGIFHCFSGTLDQARAAIDLGFVLGIGGSLTYKNSELPALLPQLPLEALVLETDSPYLAPVPHRGRRNEPAYLPHIAERLAALYARPLADILAVTGRTVRQLFHPGAPETHA